MLQAWQIFGKHVQMSCWYRECCGTHRTLSSFYEVIFKKLNFIFLAKVMLAFNYSNRLFCQVGTVVCKYQKLDRCVLRKSREKYISLPGFSQNPVSQETLEARSGLDSSSSFCSLVHAAEQTRVFVVHTKSLCSSLPLAVLHPWTCVPFHRPLFLQSSIPQPLFQENLASHPLAIYQSPHFSYHCT